MSTTFVDSRLGPGTLTIATADYSYQIANVALEPNIKDSDGTPTLATPAPPPIATLTWHLKGKAIQDWQLGATSFLNYLMDHALEEVAFDFTPSTADGVKYNGTAQLRPAAIGGDAGVQITSDFDFPVVGTPTRVDPPLGAAASAKKAA